MCVHCPVSVRSVLVRVCSRGVGVGIGVCLGVGVGVGVDVGVGRAV